MIWHAWKLPRKIIFRFNEKVNGMIGLNNFVLGIFKISHTTEQNQLWKAKKTNLWWRPISLLWEMSTSFKLDSRADCIKEKVPLFWKNNLTTWIEASFFSFCELLFCVKCNFDVNNHWVIRWEIILTCWNDDGLDLRP